MLAEADLFGTLGVTAAELRAEGAEPAAGDASARSSTRRSATGPPPTSTLADLLHWWRQDPAFEQADARHAGRRRALGGSCPRVSRRSCGWTFAAA